MEKRLTDADAILQKIQLECNGYLQTSELTFAGLTIAKKIIEDAPAVDAVEVVRCKDCIYAELSEDGDLYCDGPIGIFGTVGFNDFCSCGERRGNDGNL